MTLRNAFDGLSTEPKQDGIISYLRNILKAVTYARTSADQMRVVMDSGSTTAVTGTVTTAGSIYWSNSNTNVGWYTTGAPASMDAREQQMMNSNVNLGISMQRWTVG